MPTQLLWSELPHWKVPEASKVVTRQPVAASLRPTLVVGIGGTGCQLVQKLKGLVEGSFRVGPTAAFQFVSLDVDVQSPASDNTLLGPDIFHNLAQPQIPIRNIITNMDEYEGLFPELRKWWPYHPAPNGVEQTADRNRDPYKPLFAAVAAGAMAVRPVGRFALWHEANRVHQYMDTKWGRACNARQAVHDMAAIGTGKVYLVCSLAGGTGSGMFLDVAYLLRSITQNAAFPAFITGVLLMDSTPFANYAAGAAIRDRMKANVYAALTELDHYMSHEPPGGQDLYDFTYNPNLAVRQKDHPFDVCYLLNVVNESGHQLRDLNDMCNMIAEAIYLEMASPMAARGRSVLDNVENLTRSTAFPTSEGEKERRMAYSSFAVASLTWDRAWTASYCASKMTFDILQRLVDGVSPEALEGNRLGGGAAAQMPAIPPRAAQPESVGVSLKQIAAMGRPNPDAFIKVREWVQGQIWTERQGLRQLSGALKSLADNLVARGQGSAEVQRQAEEADEQIRQLAAEISQKQLRLAEASRGGKKLVGQADQLRNDIAKLEKDRDALDAIGSKLRREVAVVASSLPIYVLNLANACAALVGDWDKFQGRVRDALDQFQKADVVFGGHPLAFNALSAVGLSKMILRFETAKDSNVSDALDAEQRRILERLMVDASPQKVETAASNLRTFADSLYAAVKGVISDSPEIRTYDLFEVIRQFEADDPEPVEAGIDHALRRLQVSSAPFWSVKEEIVRDMGEVAAVNLVGYETMYDDEGRALKWLQRLPEVLGQASPVAHGVPDRLVLLQTRHGAPGYSIAASNPDLRRSYYALMQTWADRRGAPQPLHVSDAWCRGGIEDMDPTPRR